MQANRTREALDPEGHETRALHSLVRFAGRDILEIGSGNGRLTWRYAQRAASVVGLESEERHVIRARAGMPAALRGRVDIRVGDVSSIELPDAAFDVVLFSWSI
jgi:16S rRNA A1518/A1519 N6-dimethyltransferase RsmA/KsgA/DIM1 with predicted DNA glycosylase/AP lyase activity